MLWKCYGGPWERERDTHAPRRIQIHVHIEIVNVIGRQSMRNALGVVCVSILRLLMANMSIWHKRYLTLAKIDNPKWASGSKSSSASSKSKSKSKGSQSYSDICFISCTHQKKGEKVQDTQIIGSMHIKLPETKIKTHTVMAQWWWCHSLLYSFIVFTFAYKIFAFVVFTRLIFIYRLWTILLLLFVLVFLSSFIQWVCMRAYLLRPTLAGCAVCTSVASYFVFDVIYVDHNKLSKSWFGCKKGHHSFRTFPHLHEFIVFTIGLPLFVISWVCSLFFLFFDICICSLSLSLSYSPSLSLLYLHEYMFRLFKYAFNSATIPMFNATAATNNE